MQVAKSSVNFLYQYLAQTVGVRKLGVWSVVRTTTIATWFWGLPEEWYGSSSYTCLFCISSPDFSLLSRFCKLCLSTNLTLAMLSLRLLLGSRLYQTTLSRELFSLCVLPTLAN